VSAIDGVQKPELFRSDRFNRWLDKRMPPANSVTLDQRKIFILPTRHGLYFAALVCAMVMAGINYQNWIRSGTTSNDDDPQTTLNEADFDDFSGVDDDEVYEGVAGGTWAPAKVASNKEHGPLHNHTLMHVLNKMTHLKSVDIVFTDDKTKWSRVPVLEMQKDNNFASGNPAPGVNTGAVGFLRDAPSLDQDGNPADTTGWAAAVAA